MKTQSLIPLSESSKFHSVDNVVSKSIDGLSKSLQAIKTLFNPDTCEAKYLPYLAYAFKVDFWDESLREVDKRALIKASLKLHQLKGTRWAILEVLKAVGLSVPNYEAVIVEYKDRNNYKYNVLRDGTHSYDGAVKHNHGLSIYDFILDHWTQYAVIIKVPVSESQVTKAKALINKYAPVRCVLKGFVSIRKQRDGTIFYNSLHTHGLI
ncbi:phage tail protein I [Sulfurimonas sp.]|uniref:phage tail protein I n=1 Tax=Sulfurimonas sp. TaxID=2022749 RepID=UPI0025FF8FDB|nr:phage tail protein I [Sulfurimonas sp.]